MEPFVIVYKMSLIVIGTQITLEPLYHIWKAINLQELSCQYNQITLEPIVIVLIYKGN